MKKGKLSDRQYAILVFIQDQVSANGFPPTIRQIGEACGIASTSVVNYNLNKLATSGYLTRTKGQSRGLRLTRQALALREVPVMLAADGMLSVPRVGRIVASAPVPHPGDDFGYYYDAEDLIEVPRRLINATLVPSARAAAETVLDFPRRTRLIAASSRVRSSWVREERRALGWLRVG